MGRGLSRTLAVAANTFRETVRERVLYNLVFFAILMTLAGLLLGQLSIRQDEKILKDIGLAAMDLFGTLIAVFIGTGLVSKEIERRSLYPLLAKPLSRGEFFLGKFAGARLHAAREPVGDAAGPAAHARRHRPASGREPAHRRLPDLPGAAAGGGVRHAVLDAHLVDARGRADGGGGRGRALRRRDPGHARGAARRAASSWSRRCSRSCPTSRTSTSRPGWPTARPSRSASSAG